MNGVFWLFIWTQTVLLLPYFKGATGVSREIKKKITAFCQPIIVEVYIQPLIELGELMQHKDSNICNRLSLYKESASKNSTTPSQKIYQMTLGHAPYTLTHLQINVHNLCIIQAIWLILWQILARMYIEKSCYFHNISCHHSRVTETTLVYADLRSNVNVNI